MTSLVFINRTQMGWGNTSREGTGVGTAAPGHPAPLEDAMCKGPDQAFSHPTLISQGRRDPRAAPPKPGD